ncbi:unnamed protein product [Paramecium sonneborni]|uniref:RRM domain-containing protein n=1 Tax=Paramecium sonneborni TaxID=65129 RepID=A0A8S1P798_9CILI|nr:unnamed protein product [Paramecium sonneborni]
MKPNIYKIRILRGVGQCENFPQVVIFGKIHMFFLIQFILSPLNILEFQDNINYFSYKKCPKRKKKGKQDLIELLGLLEDDIEQYLNQQSIFIKIFFQAWLYFKSQLQTKVFIEYDEVDSAIDAIKFLNNTKIFNQISCNVNHSRLKQLKLDIVPYTKGLDFTNPPSSTNDQVDTNCEQEEITKINEWEDYQFENDSTEEVYDEEETQFSEEKMIDIKSKLNQIDEEINKTIETKIDKALDRLHQNTICIQVLITYDILNDLNFIIKIFCHFGQIKYLKQSQIYLYIKYGSNHECQKAFQLLKEYLEIKLQYNFENLNGKLIQPNNQKISIINQPSKNFSSHTKLLSNRTRLQYKSNNKTNEIFKIYISLFYKLLFIKNEIFFLIIKKYYRKLLQITTISQYFYF